MMKLDPRPASVLTGKENLEILHTFKDFPVFFGTVDTPAGQDLRADMEWALDPETGVIQLTKLVPLEILYREQHVDGCGPTWRQYYEDFGSYILERGPRAVVEIGGGAGALAKIALARQTEMRWTIVEPNPTIAAEGNLHIIRGFFAPSLLAGQEVDAIVFSQVMEHVYDPRSFLADIANFLKPGQRLIFAYPNLARWLDRKFTTALNFEHTMLLTDRHLDTLLPEYGLRVVDKTPYGEHSYFYTAEKSAAPCAAPAMPNLSREYRALFDSFLVHHRKTVEELNRIMRSSPGEFYLFGAHIFSTFLFAFGLEAGRIRGILDNSPTKRGRRLYGTEFIVDHPEILRGKRDAVVILRTGFYDREIREDIVNHINANVRFI
jgi:SAM-dependent methyltransferase